MILAIVGSRDLTGNTEALELIRKSIIHYQPSVILSGGAVGIDSMAREMAQEMGIQMVEYLPDIEKWEGKGGYKDRNAKIADSCDALVRIVSSNVKTYGSGWTADRAEKRGINVDRYVVEVPA